MLWEEAARMSEIAEHLAGILERLKTACQKAGRAGEAARLLAVSKTFPVGAVREAAAAGQELFGESRVQEAVEKIPQLPSRLRWHFIGHLQKNKIRKILPLVEALHSVDSVELAADIERIGTELGLRPRVFLQVNIAADASKFGFQPEVLRGEMERILALRRLEVVGLMTIPPLVPEAEMSRRHFAALREFRDALEREFGVGLPELSMGMSGDFEVAAEEGATLVRVGSAIFGGR